MKLRRNIATVHKWTGLAVALFLLVQSLTGLVLVYRAEIHTLLAGGRAMELGASDNANLQQVVAKAARTRPGQKVSRVVYPTLAGQPYIVYFNDSETLQIESIVGIYSEGGQVQVSDSVVPAVLDAIFRLHHVLLLDNDAGRYAVGITGSLLAVMVLTGIYIWWPGLAKLGYSLRITPYRNPVTFFWQLHRTIGVAGFMLVLVTASSGVLLAFGPELRSALVAEAPTTSARHTSGRQCDDSILNAQVRSARSRFPDSPIRDVRFTNSSETLARVLFVNRTRSGLGPPHQVWLEPCGTGIVALSPGTKRLDADGVLSWTYPVHTGIALGYPGRFLSVIAGTSILATATTGVLLWNSRNRLKRVKRTLRTGGE